MIFTASGTYTEPLCPLCDGASGTIIYDYPDIKIIRCSQCGLCRTCPRLSPDALTKYYEKQYYSDQIAQTGNYEKWRDDNADVWLVNALLVKAEAELRRMGQSGRIKLLDVGSGHGFFLDECVKLGMDAHGIETSPHAVKYSVETLKLEVRTLALDDLPTGEKYDVITLWGVLEHVPNPLLTMKQAHAHLNPGGMIWVMTPNTHALDRFLKGKNWFNFLNKSHLTHFERGNLKQLLERAGFKNVRRYLHYGGGARHGIGKIAQYGARLLCIGTELRFIGERER
jgi:2-polyprenyl-3-methyl-5-hydroxy-6-metoxy-1,4-benzoquinol methylase